MGIKGRASQTNSTKRARRELGLCFNDEGLWKKKGEREEEMPPSPALSDKSPRAKEVDLAKKGAFPLSFFPCIT